MSSQFQAFFKIKINGVWLTLNYYIPLPGVRKLLQLTEKESHQAIKIAVETARRIGTVGWHGHHTKYRYEDVTENNKEKKTHLPSLKKKKYKISTLV